MFVTVQQQAFCWNQNKHQFPVVAMVATLQWKHNCVTTTWQRRPTTKSQGLSQSERRFTQRRSEKHKTFLFSRTSCFSIYRPDWSQWQISRWGFGSTRYKTQHRRQQGCNKKYRIYCAVWQCEGETRSLTRGAARRRSSRRFCAAARASGFWSCHESAKIYPEKKKTSVEKDSSLTTSYKIPSLTRQFRTILISDGLASYLHLWHR